MRLMTSTAFVLLVALVGSRGGFGVEAVAISEQERLEKAVAYLQTVAYNPDLELCREAPRVAPNVYWVASDNLLAYKALEPYDSKLASTIRSRLVEIGKEYRLPVSRRAFLSAFGMRLCLGMMRRLRFRREASPT